MSQSAPTSPRETTKTIILLIVAAVAVATAIALGAIAFLDATQADMPKWILARSSGIVSYLLLWLTSIFGILVSHPDSPRWHWMTVVTRLRVHIGFSTFAVAFTLLHMIVLATDDYADVGWLGAFLPMAAQYRPVPVTLGVIAFWGMVLAGLTAALSNTRIFRRSWLWIHRISLSFYILAWVHGMLAGSDTPSLLALYLSTGAFVIVLAAWRYATPSMRNMRKGYARGSKPRIREDIR